MRAPILTSERRILWPAATVGLVMLVGTTAVVLGPWLGHSAALGDAVSTLSSLLAAACCVVAASGSTGAARRSWSLFGSTMAMWATADILWLVDGLAGDVEPLITVADTVYLVGLVPVCAGLLLFPVGKWERGAGLRLVLDALVLGCALLLASYLLVLREVVERVGLGWDAVVYGIYPVTDVLLAGLAALLVLRTAGRPRPDLVLIGLAFVTWTATDNGFALSSARGGDGTQTGIVLGYIVAPLLLGLAALSVHTSGAQVRTVQRHTTGTLAALLPDLMALFAGTLCIVRGLEGWQDWVLASLALFVTGVRQLVLTADHHALRQSLESRVTERAEALQRLSDRHQRILASMGEGIFDVDQRGRISFVNPAGARLLGWDHADLLGRDACATLCPQEHEECPLSLVTRLGDVVTQAETEFARRDGSHLPVEITAAPNLGPDGTHGAVVVFRDVTERHVVDQMKGEFVSAVSHELRTPLTAIRGSLELLADGAAGALPDDAQQIIALAERGSQRLTRLVNDIIDVERLESGSFRLQAVPQELGPLVEASAASLQSLADRGGVQLLIGPVSGRALCDPDRVTQVLTNLIGNALKFTPPGRSVRVTAVPGEHEVTVAVRDDGRGIPADQLESIFERFHQVNISDSREQGGTGLGLTITQSIVERHGGRIWVESELEVGSTFRFTLPLVPEPVQERRSRPSSPISRVRR